MTENLLDGVLASDVSVLVCGATLPVADIVTHIQRSTGAPVEPIDARNDQATDFLLRAQVKARIEAKNKAAILRTGQALVPDDVVMPEEQIKDPYVLEFLDLKEEYGETDLEAALIAKLESLLLELGGDFTFVRRQRRLRVGDEWHRIDLLFFHRRHRCLVISDQLAPACWRATMEPSDVHEALAANLFRQVSLGNLEAARSIR
jgi:predicted nuclease of restriction endonuclease-like (RecB) superfamily